MEKKGVGRDKEIFRGFCKLILDGEGTEQLNREFVTEREFKRTNLGEKIKKEKREGCDPSGESEGGCLGNDNDSLDSEETVVISSGHSMSEDNGEIWDNRKRKWGGGGGDICGVSAVSLSLRGGETESEDDKGNEERRGVKEAGKDKEVVKLCDLAMMKNVFLKGVPRRVELSGSLVEKIGKFESEVGCEGDGQLSSLDSSSSEANSNEEEEENDIIENDKKGEEEGDGDEEDKESIGGDGGDPEVAREFVESCRLSEEVLKYLEGGRANGIKLTDYNLGEAEAEEDHDTDNRGQLVLMKLVWWLVFEADAKRKWIGNFGGYDSESECSEGEQFVEEFENLLEFSEEDLQDEELYEALKKRDPGQPHFGPADEFCGRTLLTARYRSGPLSDNQFKPLFHYQSIDIPYDRSTFQAKCILCDRSIMGKEHLAEHIDSEEHKTNILSLGGYDKTDLPDKKFTRRRNNEENGGGSLSIGDNEVISLEEEANLDEDDAASVTESDDIPDIQFDGLGLKGVLAEMALNLKDQLGQNDFDKVNHYLKEAEKMDLEKRNKSFKLLDNQNFMIMLSKLCKKFNSMFQPNMPQNLKRELNLVVYSLNSILEVAPQRQQVENGLASMGETNAVDNLNDFSNEIIYLGERKTIRTGIVVTLGGKGASAPVSVLPSVSVRQGATQFPVTKEQKCSGVGMQSGLEEEKRKQDNQLTDSKSLRLSPNSERKCYGNPPKQT